MAGGDLLVVGAGTLGMRLIKQYKEEHPSAHIVACTNTTKRHAELKALGAEPALGLPDRQFPNVAFLATPNAKDYIGLCNRTLDAWSAPSEVFPQSRNQRSCPCLACRSCGGGDGRSGQILLARCR